MEIENKSFINGKEVILIAEYYPTQIYQEIKDSNKLYIVCYKTIITTITLDDIDVEIDGKYLKHELL